MHQYELMVILDPEIDERTVAPSLDKFLNVVRNDGGTIDKVDVWGRRRLAYGPPYEVCPRYFPSSCRAG